MKTREKCSALIHKNPVCWILPITAALGFFGASFKKWKTKMKMFRLKQGELTLVSALSLFVIATQNTQAIENEVWISPIGPANTTASGTPSDPFRCPDAASLDTVLLSVLVNNNLTLHFMGGTFLVSSNGIIPRAGWKLRGSGIDNTIVKFQATAFTGGAALNGVSVVGGNGPSSRGRTDGAEVSDMTVDCNFQNLSGLSHSAAVNLSGNATRISRVKAINWGNATSGGNECFVLTLQAPDYSHATNCIIEDCVVTQPAPVTFGVGVTAICIIIDGANTPIGIGKGSIIRNNLVMNIQTGTGTNQPQYFHAYTVYGTATISHNYANDLTGNAAAGIYQDTGNGRDVVIEGNVFDNVYACISYNMQNYNMTDLVIKNNVFRPAEGGAGISYYTGELNGNTNAFAKNLLVLDNVIYPSSSSTNTTAFGFDTYITATVLNNILQGNGSGLDFSVDYGYSPAWWNPYPHPIQLNTWAGNVNMAGTQLVEGNDAWWQPGDQDTIKFTPTTNGWYRVLVASGQMAASIQLQSEFWNNDTTDTEFWFRANAYITNTPFGELNVSRRGSYYGSSGHVTAARIVSDDYYGHYNPALYLDIYIPTVTSDVREIKVTSKGFLRSRLIAAPTLITTTPPLYQQINF